MTVDLPALWTHLSATPLLGLTLTVLAYQGGRVVYHRCGRSPLLHPVLLAVAALVAVLGLTGTGYDTYFAGAKFIHFLLGPATVALAVPLYRNLSAVKRSAGAVATALVLGSVTAVVGGVGIAWALGASTPTLLSLAPKSVTTPIAMGISERLGGLPSLTAVAVIVTGIVGAALGPWVLTAFKVSDPSARGLAIGVASHGIGTAAALAESDKAGAFAGLAMGLNGLLTALLLPLLVGLVAGLAK